MIRYPSFEWTLTTGRRTRKRHVFLVGNPWEVEEPRAAMSRSLNDDVFVTAKIKRPGLAMASFFSLAIFVFTLPLFYLKRSNLGFSNSRVIGKGSVRAHPVT